MLVLNCNSLMQNTPGQEGHQLYARHAIFDRSDKAMQKPCCLILLARESCNASPQTTKRPPNSTRTGHGLSTTAKKKKHADDQKPNRHHS